LTANAGFRVGDVAEMRSGRRCGLWRRLC
jgi:hypothetical protein